MLKSEAEQMVRRVLEDHPGWEMTEEQITVIAQIVLKISERIVEEAISQISTSSGGR